MGRDRDKRTHPKQHFPYQSEHGCLWLCRFRLNSESIQIRVMRSIFFHCSYGNPIDIHSAIARTSSARGMWQSLYRFLHASKYSRYFQSEAIGILYLISIFHSRTMIFHWFHHMLQAISLRLFNSSPMWLYIWVLDHTCAINLPPVPRSPFPNNGLNPVCESVCSCVCSRVCVKVYAKPQTSYNNKIWGKKVVPSHYHCWYAFMRKTEFRFDLYCSIVVDSLLPMAEYSIQPELHRFPLFGTISFL